MQVNKNNVTQFMTATNMCFMVPVYQRNYDWGEDNCKQLWADLRHLALDETSKTHFLGTICSKTTNSREKSIIDGQQRLTTLSLLIKAMHDRVENESFKRNLDERFLRNTDFGVSPEHVVKLHLNRRDDAIFNKLLARKTFEGTDDLTADEASSSVYLNYLYFYERMGELTDAQMLAVRDALDRMVIVDLDVESENPQEIFESLNSTGLDLTDVDLLRNYLLMSLDHETQTRLYEDYWFRIEQNVGPANMVRFFVDYLIYVKRSDAITLRGRKAHINERNLYAAFKDYYRDLSDESGKYLTSKDATERVLASMHACSEVYRRLVFPEGADMNAMGAMDRAIFSTVYLNQAVGSRPVLLYVMDGYLNRGLAQADALAMLEACLSLVLRSRVVGTTGINGQFAGNVLQRLPEAGTPGCLAAFWRAITSGKGKYAFPTDDEFREALTSRNIFEVLRSKGTKYLLYALEQGAKSAKGLPGWDSSFISIEHIMPQTLSPEWEKYLGEDADYHEDYLNKLGNLALTSNNSEMSNRPFSAEGATDKRGWYAESSFYYTRRVADLDDWSCERIRKRGEQLADKCLETWTLPDEYQPEPEAEHKGKRRPPFRFSMIGLAEGDEVALAKDPTKVAVVAGEWHVTYDGATYSLTRLAQDLLGKEHGIAGPWHFTYNGKLLGELRNEAEASQYQNDQQEDDE